MEIKIPKEVRQHSESIFFGLSVRQLICSALAVAVAVSIYFALRNVLGRETASWACVSWLRHPGRRQALPLQQPDL